MSLKQWAADGWLKAHKTSPQEIGNLPSIVRCDLADAGQEGLSADWRFGIAYHAALKLCAILLYAEGYMPEKTLAHYRTIQALPVILGQEFKDDADYLNACRSKRNVSEYESAGGVTHGDAGELIGFTVELEAKVMEWLRAKHRDLLAKAS